MNRRKLLVILGIIGLAVVLLYTCPLTFMFLYNRIDRITNFQPVGEGIQLADTDYIMHIAPAKTSTVSANLQGTLENTSTHATYPILKLNFGYHPTFTVLRDQGMTYLVTEQDSPGSNDAFYFFIYDITSDVPVEVGMSNVEPYQSCVYPRLDSHQLLFEMAYYCEWYPIMPREKADFYSVPLG
jgi:hypothetical protein